MTRTPTRPAPPDPAPVPAPVPAPAPVLSEAEARQVLLGNFAGHLYTALTRRPSATLRVGALLAPDPSRPGAALRASLAVATGPARPGHSLAATPLMIVEAMGPVEEDHVRKVKLPAFRALPDCREIVLVHDSRLYCEVHRRLSGARWITDLLLDRDARLRLEGAGLDLPLSVLYAQTGLIKG